MDNLQIMDSRLHGIHSTVDSATLRFKRRKAGLSHIILPRSGSPVPLTLVIPVFVDSCMDGFLIGLTGVLSMKTGMVLALVIVYRMVPWVQHTV